MQWLFTFIACTYGSGVSIGDQVEAFKIH